MGSESQTELLYSQEVPPYLYVLYPELSLYLTMRLQLYNGK